MTFNVTFSFDLNEKQCQVKRIRNNYIRSRPLDQIPILPISNYEYIPQIRIAFAQFKNRPNESLNTLESHVPALSLITKAILRNTGRPTR